MALGMGGRGARGGLCVMISMQKIPDFALLSA